MSSSVHTDLPVTNVDLEATLWDVFVTDMYFYARLCALYGLSRVKDTRKVLKVMRALPVGILDSKEISGNLYSEEMELGGKWDVWSLKSKLTGLPKNLVGDLTATVFGNRIPLVSGGIESRGLETILRRLLGPYGLLKDIIQSRMSLYDLLRPLSSQHFGIMAEKIREFINRVNVFLIAIFSHFTSFINQLTDYNSLH